jgi:exonuclease VII small subunit
MELARLCDKKLGEVEKSVEIVLKEASGEWKTAPFDPGRAAEDEDDGRP